MDAIAVWNFSTVVKRSFEVREVPAASILLRTLRHPGTARPSGRLIRERSGIEQTWVAGAVEGRWFGGLRSAARGSIGSAANKVAGTVTWAMNRRPADTVGIYAPDALYLRDRDAWETESIHTDEEGYAMGFKELVLAGLRND